MTSHLLDTTFLIDYLAGDEGVKTYLSTHESEPLLTSTLSWTELMTGRRLHGEFDPAALSATFDWLEVVAFDANHAAVASEFEAALYESDAFTRRQIDAAAADLLIAAVADAENATVVTRNVEDFEPFDVSTAKY